MNLFILPNCLGIITSQMVSQLKNFFIWAKSNQIRPLIFSSFFFEPLFLLTHRNWLIPSTKSECERSELISNTLYSTTKLHVEAAAAMLARSHNKRPPIRRRRIYSWVFASFCHFYWGSHISRCLDDNMYNKKKNTRKLDGVVVHCRHYWCNYLHTETAAASFLIQMWRITVQLVEN